ncbi:hypothetical protein CFP59_02933 [Streptomyces malaysiensis subsp. malaysiensis]|uniref:hypothetical protein n=1 Tax=Streptomyces sp. SID8382 TaxID=2690362 RepID=UPI000C2C851C|nr:MULTISPECIES: hypothetical protein [unclassified Streptomyces]AUA10832.1 hypothetical protein CFP59_02933 [Streptomyces sp. M56]
MAAVGGADTRGLRPVRWVLALALGGVWWWSVLRLAIQPGEAGPVEGAFAAGGWGLSLLPVHCGPSPRRGGRRPRQGGPPRQDGPGPGPCGPAWQLGHQKVERS